jgi:serine/threonine-protein kinase
MSEPITRLNAALGGRYRIERELGEGGMATVYLADDLKHGRQVALKVLKPELAAAVGAERFLAEIKTTAGLQHPHILPLFDSGAADGLLFYVMPYVRGESLAERLERTGPLPVGEALSVLEDVSSALAHAHATGIVHRDVKPANVLLSDGGAFVADFGIALALSGVDRAQLTATGLSLGTPNYMSPEQIGGDEAIDGRSDVYALGCLLFEALVGTPPFEAATLQGLMGKVMTEPPPALRGRRSDVPVEISDAVAKALAKRPGDRFATAQDFYTACSATSGPAARGPLPRLLLVGAGVVVVAAGIAGWRTVQTSNARSLLPEIERLAEAGSYVQAYDLAEDAQLWLAEDSTLDALMEEVSDLLTITSEPPGAGVFLQRAPREVAEAQDRQLIGTTPLTEYRVPRASHRVVIRLEGRTPVERIASAGPHSVSS